MGTQNEGVEETEETRQKEDGVAVQMLRVGL